MALPKRKSCYEVEGSENVVDRDSETKSGRPTLLRPECYVVSPERATKEGRNSVGCYNNLKW